MLLSGEKLGSSCSPASKSSYYNVIPQNVDHFQNNSISSSISSSSSVTNSSIGNNAINLSVDAPITAFQVVKSKPFKRSSVSPSYSKSHSNDSKALSYSQKNLLNRHSSITSNHYNSMVNQKKESKDTFLTDKIGGCQVKTSMNPNYSSLHKKAIRDNEIDTNQRSNSYCFNTFDPNRMSSYDNNDLLQGYLALCNSKNSEEKPDYRNSQNIIISNPNEKEVNIDFGEQTGIIPAYAKRVSYGVHNSMHPQRNFRKGSKEMSISCLDNSDNRDYSTNKILNKTASSSNLFARALNYAFKKNNSKHQNPQQQHQQSDIHSTNETWQAKLGKYLKTTTGLNKQPKFSNHSDACNLDIEDDLSANFHLSRNRNPVKKTNSNNNTEFNLNTVHTHSGAKPVNSNPSVNHLNSTQLFLCLSSSSSSSASNNSTSLSTPASFEAQNISSGNKNQANNNSTIPNIDVNSNSSSNEKEMKRSLSKSKSNSQKISELASCVGQPKEATNQNTTNHGSSTGNRKIINNGFNSLRKMLKISTPADPSKSVLSTKKNNRNKCLSASATPLPSCLAPNQFGNSYTDSQNSAYSSVKVKTKDKKNKLEGSPYFNKASSKMSLYRNSVTSLNSSPSTPKSSKHSTSLNPSNFTKSIVNQTSSSFSSASLSSTNYTPDVKQHESSPNKQSYFSMEPMNQSLSHASLNTKPFQAITNDNSPESRHKIQYSTGSKQTKSKAYSISDSFRASKDYKSEKSVLPKNSDKEHTATQSEKKMINMLKVYKNVLNKMQKTTTDSNNGPAGVSKKLPSGKNFQPPVPIQTSHNNNNNQHINVINSDIKKRYSDELKSQQQASSFSSNKINKKSLNSSNYSVPISSAKTSPLKIVNPENNNTDQMANAIHFTNSLKNVNRKAKKLTKISPEEEIMCDLEVASYFDDRAFKNDAECEDIYFYEDSIAENQSKYANTNQVDSYIIDDQNLENDSKNLEVLVRQLAAEAALSTLNDSTLNKHNKTNESDYMKSFNDIFGKVNEANGNGNNYLHKNKNKNFNNYELSLQKIKTKNKPKVYSEEDERLVYDLIENEFGLNEDDYNLIKELKEQGLNDNESFSDEYNNRSSESISPTNFKFIDHDSHDMNSRQKFSYEDEVESLFKSNASSSYEVDNIENWLDNFNNLKIQPSKGEQFKNGFLSLKVKPQRNGNNKLKNSFNYTNNYLHPKKRSSSSTSFQPACNYLQIVEKPSGPTRTNSITIDISDSNLANRSQNNFNDNNTQIKIEKKIRLNYQRPQDINSILNFGTLC